MSQTEAVVTLLRQLILSSITSSLPQTALFLSERLQALDPLSELAVYLLSESLSAAGQDRAAISVLRGKVRPLGLGPATDPLAGSTEGDKENAALKEKGKGKGKSAPTASSFLANQPQLPAIETSVRCAYVYARCCGKIGRPKDGQEVLKRAQDKLKGKPQGALPLLDFHSGKGNCGLTIHAGE